MISRIVCDHYLPFLFSKIFTFVSAEARARFHALCDKSMPQSHIETAINADRVLLPTQLEAFVRYLLDGVIMPSHSPNTFLSSQCGLEDANRKSWSQWTTAECVEQLRVFVKKRGRALSSIVQIRGLFEAFHVKGAKLASFTSRGALEAICIFDAKDQDVLLQWAEYVRKL